MPGPERRAAEVVERVDPYGQDIAAAAAGAAGAAAVHHLPQAGIAMADPGPVDPAAQQAAFKAAIAAAAAAAQAAAAQSALRAAHQPQQRSGPAPMPVQEPGGPTFVKVSVNSNPKGVAGKVAHTCRAGDAPAILAIGSGCINQGVKAIAIARGYLTNDGQDLTFQTAFREGGTPEKPSVALYMAKHPVGWPITPNNVEMQVGPTSGVQVISAALAQRIREGIVPCLTGMGVDAVSNCVLAIGHTRLALEPDGLDIRARPEFIHVNRGGADLNAIKFHIHVDRI